MLYLQGFPTNIFPTFFRFFFIEMIFGKGDLPALAKLANMKRTHSHVPRAGSSKKACLGICWMCDAGKEPRFPGDTSHPYEDTSINASWTTTVAGPNGTLPWDTEPVILSGLPMVPLEKPNFFLTDCWHNFHLGLAKHFLASSFVCAIERLNSFPATSVESRFDFLTQDFADFCRLKNIHAYMKEISRETCSFPSSKACPVGRWSKGVVASQWMAYLENYCDRFVVNKTDDPVMLTIVLGQNIQYRKSFHFLFQLPHGFVLNGLMGPLVW